MAAKLDPTQENIFRNLQAFPTERLCEALHCSPQQLSDYKACRRVLSPRGMKRLAEMAGDAVPVVGEIVRKTGQEIRSKEAPASDSRTAGSRMQIALIGVLSAHASATAPESPGGIEITAEEWIGLSPLLESVAPIVEAMRRHAPVSPQLALVSR